VVALAALTDADRARIAASVTEAEKHTSVELRLVLAHWSSHYGAFALIYPALAALVAGGVGAAVMPEIEAARLFIGQAGVFLVLVILLQNHALRRALAPPAVRRKAGWRHARLHYADIGLKLPHTGNAVLIFCSAAERYAEILVDDAIAETIPDTMWRPVVERFRADLARGAVADAFVQATQSCADILAPAFPPEPGRPNSIPDSLVEL
jgi:putative membrane protein